MTTHSITERILCPICRAPNRLDANFCQQCGNDVLLDATYRITRVIKEGGMGVVYQAIDQDGAVYAIKEMHDRFTNPQERKEGIERFLHEAELLGKLKGHPGIPHIYGSFIDEGRYYLSMEFIFGEDLEDIVKREHRFPEYQVLLWADQLCDVLEYLHQNHLIYRDMKPSNVMITRDGSVKVVDFGIAKLLQPGHRGTMIGTPGYAPPEQYQGIATTQSDVYALAATLHHLLTGRDPRDEPPFSFPPARTIQPDISLATSQALEKALQLELEDRFKSVSELRRALPIPTGDRRPTRAFDPIPAAQPQRQVQRPAPPQAPPRTQRRAERPVLPSPAPQPRAPQPQAPDRAEPRRRGGVGRAIRRLAVAGLLTYGAIQWGPELITIAQPYITNLIQSLPTDAAPIDSAPIDTAPAGGYQLQQFTTEVEVQVTDNADEAAINEALRQAFLTEAQKQFPGAQLGNTPLGRLSPPEEVGSGAGYKRLRVSMSGYINVPRQ